VLDGARTIGNLTFADNTTASHNWTLNTGSGGPLTLDVTTGVPTIAVNNRTATLNVVLAGTKGLAKTGAGNLTLGGANLYSGDTTITPVGDTTAITAANASAFGTGAVLLNGVNTFAPGLSVNTGLVIPNALTLKPGSGRAVLGLSGTANWSGAITVDGSASAGLAVVSGGGTSASPSMISGNIGHTGTNANTLVLRTAYGHVTGSIAYGTGTVQLLDGSNWQFSNASNTWGTLDINHSSASVWVGASNTLSPTGVVTSSGAGVTGTLRLTNFGTTQVGYSQTIAGLKDTGTGKVNVTSSQPATLTLDTPTNQSSSGVISGAVSLVKSGPATQTLTGTHTYTGTTTVSGGTLNVTGALAGGTTTVNGGVLAGTGTLGGPTTVNAVGTLAPGSNGIGTLSINNSLSLLGTVAMEVNKTGTTLASDRVQGVTNLTYSGTLAVTATGDALAAGDTFTLFSATSYAGSFTTLNLPTLGAGLAWNTSQLGVNGTVSVVPATYTLTYTAGANGTLSGTTPQTVNHGTSGSAVTAVPDTGYHFVDWSDGSTTNPRTDSNVTGNLSVTANFAINTYTLTYTAGANGSLSGSTPQTVNYGGSSSAVTAVPDSGYSFVNWSDGSTANPRTDTNVTADLTVTANFTATGPGPLPAPWTAGTIGSISATVSATHLNGTFNVTGGGAGISGKNDNFYFVSQPWSGTCTITARVASLQNTGSAAKAGVMLRESTATGSRSVFVGLTPTSGAQWVRRSSTGGNSSTTTSTGKAAPYWVRLTREGNTITSYLSPNGTIWTPLASASISMANNYSLGLAICSGSSGTPNTAVFDNVSVTNTLPPPPEVSPLIPDAPLPILEALTLGPDTIGFAITGEATGSWTLQESTDFVNWTSLQTIDLTAGGLQHSEADDRGALRFFRLQSDP